MASPGKLIRIGTGQGVLIVQAAQVEGEAEGTGEPLVRHFGILDGETLDTINCHCHKGCIIHPSP